jgi:uncharacterized membrane protein (UPF0127 family)
MRALTITLVLLLLAGCAGGPSKADTKASGGDSSGAAKASDLRTLTIDSGREEVEVRVEIADSPDEQARGLMERTALAQDRGMLFVFPDEEVRSFWMKNTLIALSIAYMDSEGRIVDLQDMKPLDDEEPHYVSSDPAKYALEVNEGFFEEHGVAVGDRAELPG